MRDPEARYESILGELLAHRSRAHGFFYLLQRGIRIMHNGGKQVLRDTTTLRARSMARVLLVDDEPDFVASASEMLRLHGHDVRTADTLANARRILDSQPSDVLLLDLMLPDGNGLELLEELEKKEFDVERVVLITGHPAIKSQIKNLSGPF